jgi:hypothetical protein
MDRVYILFELYIVLEGFKNTFREGFKNTFRKGFKNKGERRGEGGGNHLFKMLLLPNGLTTKSKKDSDVHCPFLIGN